MHVLPPFLFTFLLLFFIQSAVAVLVVPDNTFSRGDKDYRNILLDVNSASLYVGGRGHLFRLWAYNINDTSGNLFAEKKLPISSLDLSECRTEGNSEVDCQPSTRFISLQDQKENLYVCSSVGMKPEIRVLDASTLTDTQDPRTEIGICSPDPNVNSTAVIVEWGNPQDVPSIYSGIRTGLAGENHLIYRPTLVNKGKQVSASMKTVYTDTNWLNEPQFVGSFDIGEYVYFFFREIAVESGVTDRVIRSRVARVCKKDNGGRVVLRHVWTSFVKARLNCSISAQYPFYFDNIQAVTKVETADDTLFYASMSTSDTAFQTSAICVFPLKAINQLLKQGTFMENIGLSWSILAPESIPSHRPGTCVPDTHKISDSDLHFAKSHLLMAEPVSGDIPIIPTRDVVFSHVLVDVRSEQNVIIALDGRKQELWKISHWKEGNTWKSLLIEHRRLSTDGPIRSAVLLPGEFLYTASPNSISQFTLASCYLHQSCSLCAVDPYCSWNSARDSCHPREKVHGKSVGWISSWAGRGSSDCAAVIRPVQINVYPSDTVHLTGVKGCEWTRQGLVVTPSDEVLVTSEDGLVVLDASESTSGSYECQVNGQTLIKYKVNVDNEECVMPRTVESYKSCWLNHCKRRNEHDFAHKVWNEQKNKVSQCQMNESENTSRH